MAKTVFDSSELKRASRLREVESELKGMQSGLDDTGSFAEESSLDTDMSSSAPSSSSPTSHKARRPEDYSSVLRESGSRGGMFSGFIAQPNGVKFENQHEKEPILLVLRRHPILNVPWILVSILMLLAPILIFPIFPFVSAVFPGIFGFFATVGWYLLTSAYIIESFLNWYFNIYIITDERIIDVDFYSLIYKEVSEAKLEKIEDVTATTAGFWGAVFNYGTIAIQTAAEKREFEFEAVPYPAKVTKFLNELIIEEEREKIEGRVM